MENTAKKEKSFFGRLVESYGLPRLIITAFLLLLLILAPFVGADLPTQISNIINRFSWNGILVLAMVPMADATRSRGSLMGLMESIAQGKSEQRGHPIALALYTFTYVIGAIG